MFSQGGGFMQRRWVKVAIAVFALVVVVIGLIPFLINADAFRPKVETQLSISLGRNITLGHLSFSLITGSLVADNISVADDPAFAATPFLEAKELHIGIELGQFIFHHKVRITSFTVDSPAIHLIHAQNGTWNFSSLGGAASSPAPQKQQESILPSLSVGKFNIKNGSATVSSLPAAGKPLACTDINLAMQDFSFTQSFPFQLSVKLPGDGSFQLDGTAGPVAEKDAAKTPFQAKLELKHFDPVAAGVVEQGKGISMVADFKAQLASDGTNFTSVGKIVASKLQLARGGSPALQPVNIDYTISDNLDTRAGRVSDISIHTGSVAMHVNGGYHPSGEAIVLDLRLSAPNLPIDQLEQLLPTFGVNLPTGSRLQGGTLTANLAITGPLDAMVIAGPVSIDNTQLAGFDLGSKIQGLNPFKSKTGGTEIQKLSADLKSSPQSTDFSNIDCSVPILGTATGSGTISPTEALDFNLVAKLNDSSAIGALADGATRLLGFVGNRARNAANNGIPLTITGTASNPSIRANVGAILKGQMSGASSNSSSQQKTSPTGLLKGLFGR
jgi:AsmA protein